MPNTGVYSNTEHRHSRCYNFALNHFYSLTFDQWSQILFHEWYIIISQIGNSFVALIFGFRYFSRSYRLTWARYYNLRHQLHVWGNNLSSYPGKLKDISSVTCSFPYNVDILKFKAPCLAFQETRLEYEKSIKD